MSEERWFVGVDWATEEHAVCLVDDRGKIVGERSFEHSGDGLAEMCTWLVKTTGAESSSLWVAIEVPHGAVVETLLEHGMVVHSVNPKQLDRFRDRHTVAGAKDDRRDAFVLADSLRTDAACFRSLSVGDATVIQLREWSRIAEELMQERLRLGGRIRSQLLRYYPQHLELAEDVASEAFLALWELVPTPEVAARVRTKAVAKLLVAHRVRRFDAEHALTLLRAKPLTVAPGTTEAATAHIASLAARLRLINVQLKDANRRLDTLTDQLGETADGVSGQEGEPRDVEILRSLPGIGRIVLATLLAEATQPLAERDYHALRALGGAAPVTKRSGKRCVVVMRRACHVRVREALYHWARVAAQRDQLCRVAYAAHRARGHSHGRALRGLADRLLTVACAMLRNRTLFDPTRRVARTNQKPVVVELKLA